jgi:hypothetical protein
MTISTRHALRRSQEERLMDAWVDSSHPYVRLDDGSSERNRHDGAGDQHLLDFGHRSSRAGDRFTDLE